MPVSSGCIYPHVSGSAHLYLVGGHDGLLKIGKTRYPRSRVLTHRKAMGSNFAWAHLFPAAELVLLSRDEVRELIRYLGDPAMGVREQGAAAA